MLYLEKGMLKLQTPTSLIARFLKILRLRVVFYENIAECGIYDYKIKEEQQIKPVLLLFYMGGGLDCSEVPQIIGF